MEQMSDQDKNALKAFANGQAFISGHAVKFPLQVQVKRDIELETSIIGDEDFMEENERNHKKNKNTKEKKSKNSDQINKIMTAAAKTKRKF